MQQSEFVAIEKIAIQADNNNSSTDALKYDGSYLLSTETCAWIHGSLLSALLIIALIRYELYRTHNYFVNISIFHLLSSGHFPSSECV